MVLLYTGLCRGVCEWCCFTLVCVVACVSGVALHWLVSWRV